VFGRKENVMLNRVGVFNTHFHRKFARENTFLAPQSRGVDMGGLEFSVGYIFIGYYRIL